MWAPSYNLRRWYSKRPGLDNPEKPTSFRQTVPTPDDLHPLVLTAVRCGLRRGTLIALQWQNIISDAGQIPIEAEKMKADEDYSAPVPQSVLEALKAYRDELAVKWAKRRRNPRDRIGPDATVFGLSETANVLRPFKAACRRAGLDLHVPRPAADLPEPLP